MRWRCQQTYGVFTLTGTETDKKWLVWRCSYCTEIDDNTDSHWILYTCYRYWTRSRSLAV